MTNKSEILKNICYTELVYGRINKKLNVQFSEKQIEEYLLRIINETDQNSFNKIGKNFYIHNSDYKIKITINSNTFRVITVDRI